VPKAPNPADRPVQQTPNERRPPSRQAEITRAVHAYLQATRKPGPQPRANTPQIAEALSLPRRAVDRALVSLRERGMKLNSKG
jgi:hypothetical protein